MKKLVLLLVTVMLSPLVLAYGVGSGSGSPLDRYISQISKDLDLTADQQERIRPVLAANAAAMMSALQQRNEVKVGDDKSEHAEGQVVRKEQKLGGKLGGIQSDTHEDLADILTPAQLAQYQKMKQDDKARTRELVRAKRY